MIGVAKPTEFLMTAQLLSGKEAYEWSFAKLSISVEKLEETTMKFAEKLSTGPTIAYGRLKTMINRLAFTGLDLQLENEENYVQCQKIAWKVFTIMKNNNTTI